MIETKVRRSQTDLVAMAKSIKLRSRAYTTPSELYTSTPTWPARDISLINTEYNSKSIKEALAQVIVSISILIAQASLRSPTTSAVEKSSALHSRNERGYFDDA